MLSEEFEEIDRGFHKVLTFLKETKTLKSWPYKWFEKCIPPQKIIHKFIYMKDSIVCLLSNHHSTILIWFLFMVIKGSMLPRGEGQRVQADYDALLFPDGDWRKNGHTVQWTHCLVWQSRKSVGFWCYDRIIGTMFQRMCFKYINNSYWLSNFTWAVSVIIPAGI